MTQTLQPTFDLFASVLSSQIGTWKALSYRASIAFAPPTTLVEYVDTGTLQWGNYYLSLSNRVLKD